MVDLITPQRGSGKAAVISLLIIIGLSLVGVITALTGGFGDRSAPPEATEVLEHQQ